MPPYIGLIMKRYPNLAHRPCCNVTQPRETLLQSIQVKSLHLQLQIRCNEITHFYKFYVFDARTVYTEIEASP